MKKIIAPFILLGVFVQCTYTQITFNKLIYFDFTFTRFSGVVATDSCYYLKSTFTDSVPPYSLGLMFSKLDLNGDMVNSTNIYSPDKVYDGVHCNMIPTSDGNFIQVAAMGDGVARAILVKHSPSLDTLLTKDYYSPLYPNLEYVVPNIVRQRPDGGFAIFFGHESIKDVDFDISLLLLDSAYNQEQFKVYASTTLQETAASLILDGDGGYIMGAERTNDNLVWENFTNRTLILKADANGDQVWLWLSPSGQLWGEAAALCKTDDGGLVVASKKGKEIPINQNDGLIIWDAMVFKLDANRNIEWQTPLRGTRPSQSTKLVEMVESIDGSGYVVTGQLIDSVSGPEIKFGTWMAKVSPGGDSLWARYFTWHEGEFIGPEPWTMAATPDGGYIVAGITVQKGIPAPGWVLKVDSFGCLVPGCHLPNPTFEAGKPGIHISIYPNPASDFLNFYYRSPGTGEGLSWRAVNGQGQVVGSIGSVSPGSTAVLPIRDWPPGAYYLQCMGRDGVIASEKFVKL
jgi:hypothetical protein